MLDRLRRLPQLSPWVHLAVAAVIVAAHALTLPVELSYTSDIFLEGLYLVLAVVLAYYIRQLDNTVLACGWMVFVHARLIDFMDELYNEPNPWVNPYLGGAVTIGGLVILVGGVYIAVEDRSEQLDRLQRQTDQLVLLNRIVRHDIRNQSTVIGGWTERLRDHVDDEGADYLDRIEEANESTLELTETAREIVDLLDEEDGPPVDLDPVPLRAAVDEAVASRAGMYEHAQIDVEAVPDAAVTADDLLPSLFRNVIDNAVQHNDGAEPTVVVSGERSDGRVTVTVADDGPGMANSQRRVLEGPADSVQLGDGMGLYFVRTLAERYGGEVTVADNEPRGTRVSVTLPVAA